MIPYVFSLVLIFFGFGYPGHECPRVASVRAALDNSTAVFAGEVVAEEYRDVRGDPHAESKNAKVLVIKLKVHSWWKSKGTEEVYLYTSVTRYGDGTESFMAEDYRFHNGESYLVYAFGPEDRLRTSGCTRTKRLAEAEEDLRELGEGREP